MHRPHPPVPRPAPSTGGTLVGPREAHRSHRSPTSPPGRTGRRDRAASRTTRPRRAAEPRRRPPRRRTGRGRGATTELRGGVQGRLPPGGPRGDLRSLPTILTHWGLLAALAATLVSTAVFILSTNEFASSLDLTLSDPAAGKPIGTISNISYIAVSLFVAPPPAAGAFLVGFTAPRASWLGGLIYGMVAAGCYSVILLSPTGRLFIGASPPQPYDRQRLDRRPARRDVLRLGVGLVQAVPQPRQPEPGPSRSRSRRRRAAATRAAELAR